MTNISSNNKSYNIFEQLMHKKGVNSAFVARSTGVSPATLSAWKNDIYTPKLEKLQILANYFEVSIDYLMGRTGNPVIPNAEELQKEQQRDTKNQEIINIYQLLTEENQRALLEYADFLLYKQNKNRP